MSKVGCGNCSGCGQFCDYPECVIRSPDRRTKETASPDYQRLAQPSEFRSAPSYQTALQAIVTRTGWRVSGHALIDRDGVFRVRTDDAVLLSGLSEVQGV